MKRPLVFTLEALVALSAGLAHRLRRMRRQQRRCSIKTQAQPLNVQAIHGLLSCSEWTGVKLSTLLDEAGVDPGAKWVLAEGADAAGMSRSFPLDKAMDDAMVASTRTASGAALERLSGAAAAARLRGQHEREMAAPHQAHGGADHDQGRDLEIHDPCRAGKAWQFVFPLEVEVDDHAALAGPRPARARASTRSRASPGRATARSARSRCRPTAARAGPTRRCRSRCCPRR